MVKDILFPDIDAAAAFIGRYGGCETTVYTNTGGGCFWGGMVQPLSVAIAGFVGRDLQQVMEVEVWMDISAPLIGIIRESDSLELLRQAYLAHLPVKA